MIEQIATERLKRIACVCRMPNKYEIDAITTSVIDNARIFWKRKMLITEKNAPTSITKTPVSEYVCVFEYHCNNADRTRNTNKSSKMIDFKINLSIEMEARTLAISTVKIMKEGTLLGCSRSRLPSVG